jgi:hypothetical protein
MTQYEDLDDARLRRVAQQLGAAAAERLDVESTARGVLERLRREARRPARPWWLAPVWLRAAAAAAAVAALGVAGALLRGAGHRARDGDELAAPASVELRELSADQLRELLQTVTALAAPGAPAAAAVVATQDVGLDDLAVPELRDLLQSLEG